MHPSTRYTPCALNTHPITYSFLTTSSSRALPVVITWSLASIPFAVSRLDYMAAPNKAWSIDDVVQDIHLELPREDGSVEKVLSTQAWVHVGPYVDVRHCTSNVPGCSVSTSLLQIVTIRREKESTFATRIPRVDRSEESLTYNVLCSNRTHGRSRKA